MLGGFHRSLHDVAHGGGNRQSFSDLSRQKDPMHISLLSFFQYYNTGKS
jgi:hypothetical protein